MVLQHGYSLRFLRSVGKYRPSRTSLRSPAVAFGSPIGQIQSGRKALMTALQSIGDAVTREATGRPAVRCSASSPR